MSRKNKENIQKHNDKLHKAKAKIKQSAQERKERLKAIIAKHNENNSSQNE